jgi:hypothetical protein
MYNNDVGKRFIVKRHSNERHPLFYFISFINPCSGSLYSIIEYK